MPTMLMSRQKWSFLNNGAIHCLAHKIKRKTGLEIHCLNDVEYRTVRYLTLQDNSSPPDLIWKLKIGEYTLWLLSDKGKR